MAPSFTSLLLVTTLLNHLTPSVSGGVCKQCDVLGNTAEFFCPRPDYPSNHTYCCGPNTYEHCCATPYPNYAEYEQFTISQCEKELTTNLTVTLIFLGVVAAVVCCCCCMPTLCCCYLVPCCPWYKSRKRKQNQSNIEDHKDEEIPMNPVPEPAGYPRHNLSQSAAYQPQPAYNPTAPIAESSYPPSQGYPYPTARELYPPQGYPQNEHP